MRAALSARGYALALALIEALQRLPCTPQQAIMKGKQMKAYLINPKANTISEVETTGGLADFYRLLDCDLVDVVGGAIPGHDLWVDDEGLLFEDEAPHGLFYSRLTGQTLAGLALVLSTNDNGDCTAATCSADEVASYLQPIADINHEENAIYLGKFKAA